ncbi:MAG: hypothetical protein LH472_13250 [Pyrinomonadaceae bacterium]|nr:hypothetical protein [Pyrinomonadaceae bacterium]
MAEHLIGIETAKTDLLNCAAYIAENIKSADGHAGAMKEIVPRYLEKGAVDLAAELANTVDDPFTRDRLLLRVAEKCAAIGDDEYAFQLIEAIEETSTRDEAREHIAAQKSANGDFAKAFEIAETLPHADFAFAEIAVRQVASGDEANALNTIEKIDFPNAKVAVFQNLALVHLEKGETAKAAELLDKAAASADEIEFTEEKIRALIDIGNHFLEAEQNGRAIEIFDKAKASAETLDNVHRDSFLGSVALGLLQAGSLELADRTLDLVADNVPTATALVGFAREFQKRGKLSEALETLEEAYSILKSQRDRDVRDSKARFGLWAAIAVEFARFEKPERAIEIAQEIADENSQTSALSQIAQICAAQNKDDAARQAVNAIADDSQKMFALIGISDVKNKSGNTDEAVNFLREAETLAETVERLALRSAAFNELARRFHDYGDQEKMRELGIENLDTIFNIRDESNRAVALAQMSDFYQSKNIELINPEREMILRIIGKSNG